MRERRRRQRGNTRCATRGAPHGGQDSTGASPSAGARRTADSLRAQGPRVAPESADKPFAGSKTGAGSPPTAAGRSWRERRRRQAESNLYIAPSRLTRYSSPDSSSPNDEIKNEVSISVAIVQWPRYSTSVRNTPLQ